MATGGLIKLQTHLAPSIVEEFRSLARENERGIAAELRVAVRKHLAEARGKRVSATAA